MFNLSGRKNPNKLELGQEGLDLIQHFEGWEPQSYIDDAGFETIGYGHKLTGREKRTGKIETDNGTIHWRNAISRQEGEWILADDAKEAEHGVQSAVQVKLKQRQYDALVSWTFNLGSGALSGSTMLEKLNAEDYQAVPDEMKRWVYAGGRKLAGLVRRRESEANLFQGQEWRNT